MPKSDDDDLWFGVGLVVLLALGASDRAHAAAPPQRAAPRPSPQRGAQPAPAPTSGRQLTFRAGINVDDFTRSLAGGSDGVGRRLQSELTGLVQHFNAQHAGTLSHVVVASASDASYGTVVTVTAVYDGPDDDERVLSRLHALILASSGDAASRLHSLTLGA